MDHTQDSHERVGSGIVDDVGDECPLLVRGGPEPGAKVGARPAGTRGHQDAIDVIQQAVDEPLGIPRTDGVADPRAQIVELPESFGEKRRSCPS